MGLYTEDEYKTKIVGVTFKNDDGTSRQDIIESCTEGESLSLEHYYYKDEDAFKVTNVYGEVLGNLKKELTERLINRYDAGTLEAADVEILNITGEGTGTLGVNIKITVTDFYTDESGNEIDKSVNDTVADSSTVSEYSYGESTSTQPATSSIQQTIENNLKLLHDKHGVKKLKRYSVAFKILFIICLLFALFALIFSIPFAILFGILAFISFKYSSLYKKAANYSE